MKHPITKATDEWLPEFDFALLSHGMANHGRDYVMTVQAGGSYELTLTHVVEVHMETRVRDDVWPPSWGDAFIDYAAWQAAGEPEGYVWGTNWSLAYPGLDAPADEPKAAEWSQRLGKPMFYMAVETDRLRLSLIFHDVRWVRVSDENSMLDKMLIPL